MQRIVLRSEEGPRQARARSGWKDASIRASQAWREGLRAGRGELLAGELNADNTRTYAVWLNDIHRRLESLRRSDSQRLRAPPRLAENYVANTTMRTSLHEARATSTGSKTSGRSQKGGSPSSTVAPPTNLCYT